MATTSAWQRFRRWRRRRPFTGGLLLLLSGLAMFFSANLSLGDLKVHFGQEGYLSYLLPAIMLLCGALIWITPVQRLFYAVVGLVTALYSLIGLNLGGFGLGMLLGILGGALAIAWTPVAPPAPVSPAGPAPADGPARSGTEEPQPLPFDRPAGEDAPTANLPANSGDTGRPGSGGTHRKLLASTLVPVVVTAGLVLAGGRSPARADDCPEGLPSRPAAEAAREAAKQSNAAPSRPPGSAKPNAAKPGSAKPGSPESSPTASAEPSPSRSGDRTGNPIVDGWNGLVEGIGDLFGIGDDSDDDSPAPGPSPSASADPKPSPSPSAPARSRPTRPAAPSPAPSADDIPCLGPRVFKEAGPDDVPDVTARGGVLETRSLTMYDSTYDGVVDLRTPAGPLRALKFSMRKAVNKPFSLTIPESGGRSTLILSDELTTDGNVRFYTPEFKGKLFGLIPVTFTPESPPPLTLPVLWFTDVRINLAFVRCDTLTAQPLDVTARA